LFEFFAGGGMARLGLGPSWRCAFANENDSVMGDLKQVGRAPRVIVLENVAGWLTSQNGKDFAAIVVALSGMGYRSGALTIDAALFVPQSRERVFLVAVCKNMALPALTADAPQADWHPAAMIKAVDAEAKRDWIWWRLPKPAPRRQAFADLIEDNPIGVPPSSSDDPGELIAMMAPKHLAKVEAAKRAGRRMVGALSKRMRPAPGGEDVSGQRVQRAEVRFDDVAGCLRVPVGGSSRQTIMIVDGDKIRSRLLSSREAARLMGLPDSYKLPGHCNDAYALCGDGVVVPVVAFLERSIIAPILNSPSALAGDYAPARLAGTLNHRSI
jgi:DNA (cytosine-5)-methyltransferase 1